MPVKIKSSGTYFRLDSWVLANIIQLGTQSFCDRFVTHDIDPCGRMYDQMTLAARSVPANIAEGISRHDTSVETEMRLTDVARASLSELKGDYFNFLLRMASRARGLGASKPRGLEASEPRGLEASEPRGLAASEPRGLAASEPRGLAGSRPIVWSVNDQGYRAISAIRLDSPNYGDDLMLDVANHILAQKAKFDPWIESNDMATAANALMFLCFRVIYILTHQLEAQLERFKAEGGFRENMTETRLQAKQEAKQQQNAPTCPQCGAPMEVKMCKSGIRSGKRFWGCTNHYKTGCNATINID